MKPNSRIVLLVSVVILLAACAPVVSDAFLDELQGQVQILSLVDGVFQPAKDGQKLVNGDEILLNADGRASLHLPDDTIIRLDPLTHISLHSLGGVAADQSLVLSIDAGSMVLNLSNGRAIVNTPGGRFEVHGGEISVSVDQRSLEVALVCFVGKCHLQNNEVGRDLNAGEYYVVAINKDEAAMVSQLDDTDMPLATMTSAADAVPIIDNNEEGIILTATPTDDHTEVAVATTPSDTGLPTMTATPNQLPELTATATTQPSHTPTQVPSPVPTSTPVPGDTIYWKIDFETGDFSQVEAIGELITQANGSHSIVSDVKHAGSYGSLLEIEEQGTDSAYFFFFKSAPNEALPDSFYLSAWVRLGAGTCSSDWWNTFQFKSSADGNSSNSNAVHSLNIRNHEIGNCSSPLEYQVFSKAPAPVDIHYQANPIPIPIDQWFHVEVYYQRDPVCGQMKVWQDGAKIFDLDCMPTVYSNDTLYPSINNYSEGLSNLYYLDDIVLANYRVGP